jgi:hypothetical protein
VVFAVLGFGLGGLGSFVTPALATGTATGAVAVWMLFGLIGLLQLLIAVHVRLSNRPAPTYHEVDLHELPKNPGRGAGGAVVHSTAPGQPSAGVRPDHHPDSPWSGPAEPV